MNCSISVYAPLDQSMFVPVDNCDYGTPFDFFWADIERQVNTVRLLITNRQVPCNRGEGYWLFFDPNEPSWTLKDVP